MRRSLDLLGRSKGEIEVQLLVLAMQRIEIERIGKVMVNDGTKGQTIGEITREVPYFDRLEVRIGVSALEPTRTLTS